MRIKIIYFFLITAMIACAQKTVEAADAGSESLDKTVVEKVKATYSSVLNNDDKKAKLLYGRNYKNMPETIQFALDLRFKNYEHALTVLPKTGKSPEEIKFWEKIVAAKPAKLSAAICDSLKGDDKFPTSALPVSHDDQKWLAELRFLTSGLSSEKVSGSPKKVSDLDAQISDISCGDQDGSANVPITTASPTSGAASNGTAGTVSASSVPAEGGSNVKTCEALSEDQQKIFLNDKYFDGVHNMQRRDTRFVQANYRNFVKLSNYQRYVTPTNLLKLYYAIKATPYARKDHYLRRLGGIGRDLRSETLVTRFIGDELLGDEGDKALLTRLSLLAQGNQLLNLSTGLEYELASCGLSGAPPATKEKPRDQ